MQHPTAPTEHPMPDPRDRWRYSSQQWEAVQRSATPGAPVAGVPIETWDRMTPAEQAKLYADQANTEAVVRSQQGTKNALWIIFVVLPIVIGIVWLMVNH